MYAYVGNDPVNFIDHTGLWSISLSGYAGWGGGIVVGQNPDGSTFVTLQAGVGLGGGVSWDPNGKSDDNVCSGVSIGQYASAGVNIGPLEGNYGLSSGFTQTAGSYYNPPDLSAGVTPSIGIKGGVSGGIQGTFHW